MVNVALLIVVVYMVLLILVSWYASRKTSSGTAEGYLFADKQLTWPLVGVMIAGIAIGGSSTVGIAQNAYTQGMSAGWYDAAWAAGALVMGLFFAEKYRSCRMQTVNQMLGAVFGNTFQVFSALLQIIINIVIISLQIIAGGAILHALLPDVFSLPQGILVSTVIFGLISMVGGLLAASLTNVVNLTMIYVGIIIGVVALVSQYGGMAAINMDLPAGMSGDGSHWYSPVKGMGLMAISAWFITMILQCTPNGGVMQNIFAAKSPEHAKKGSIFAAILIFPAGFISAMIGIVAASQVQGLASSAMALPAVVMTLPGWIAGIILSGLWAADVSTATGLMMGAGSMFCEDILFKYFIKTKNPRTRMIASRIVVLIIIIVAYFGATQVSNILGSLMKALTLFTPYAVILTSMFLFPKTTKRITGWLTFIGGTVAFVLVQFVVPAWRIGGQAVYTVLLVSILMFLLSQLDKRPAPLKNLYRNE